MLSSWIFSRPFALLLCICKRIYGILLRYFLRPNGGRERISKLGVAQCR
ncbi:hypothetical protein THIOSC15_410012 [uncultured Thiomicrorhabdus sp.]